MIYFSQCDEVQKSGPPKKACPTGALKTRWELEGHSASPLDSILARTNRTEELLLLH